MTCAIAWGRCSLIRLVVVMSVVVVLVLLFIPCSGGWGCGWGGVPVYHTVKNFIVLSLA